MSILMMGVLAAITLIVGGVIDYGSLANQNRELQDVADGAALAAAREMIIAQATDDRVSAIAQSYTAANYTGDGVEAGATIVDGGKAVRATVEADPKVYFPGPIGLGAKGHKVRAEATAEISGGGNVCMIGLDQKAPSTLNMSNSARLTASGCAIYSNSTSDSSLKVANMARVRADLVCVSGGVSGAKSAINPEPIEDCAPISDPLADRPDPKLGLLDCDKLATVSLPIVGNLLGKTTLKPGTYCGGIIVAGKVKLEPGIYTINNGLLSVLAGGTLEGENVGFYLTGASSTLLFAPTSTISLTAPKTGPLAGILFFEDRDTVFRTYHHIQSNNARRLVGTMYFPNSKLRISANNPVADKSEYTVIVAKEFQLDNGPELVLKTDYGASPIPLPDGVGNKAKPQIRLKE